MEANKPGAQCHSRMTSPITIRPRIGAVIYNRTSVSFSIRIDCGVRYLRVQSMKWLAAGALLVLVGATGCGSQYRPVITPVPPTGPAAQPTAYVLVFSQPGLVAPNSLPASAPPCPATAYANPGVATIIDFAGDSIMAQAEIGTGPLTFALNATGGEAYSLNCDNTMSTVPVSITLQTKNVGSSTFFSGAAPFNMLASTTTEYIVEQGRNAVGAFTGNPPSLAQEVKAAPSLINVTGAPGAQRVFAISQGNSSANGGVTWGQCATPSLVTANGEADGIEVATNTISSRLTLGVCPVYGITSADGLRTFIMNRGSGTVSVINNQLNQLDTAPNPNFNNGPNTNLGSNATINLCPGTTGTCNAGPVYAQTYTVGNMLVTSNFDNNTVSFIDVSLDIYGNDSATFGKVLGTAKVGANPASFTILQDGSRVYTANEGDGTVTVVNMSSFTPQATIPVSGTPSSANTITGTMIPQPRTIDSAYNYPTGKVYVTAQNSQFVTVIRTDTDVVSAAIQVQGNVVDLHTTAQYTSSSVTSGNLNVQSHAVGSGIP
jgi:YVTN family beta-propeller protein